MYEAGVDEWVGHWQYMHALSVSCVAIVAVYCSYTRRIQTRARVPMSMLVIVSLEMKTSPLNSGLP